MKTYRRALTIAGFDGSGGAGIQADLKTFSALGCYGMTVLTALPVQNTQGVLGIYEIPVNCVAEQLSAILDDVGVDVIKIGMLHRTEIIEAIAQRLRSISSNVAIVCDPVMVAKSGDRLLNESAVNALRQHILPLTTVLTPNLPEASDLLNRPIETEQAMAEAARELASQGPRAVVIKGGHLQQDQKSKDCLYIRDRDKLHWFESPRIDTKNTHGTGCTFSAAIAAYLGHGEDIANAVGHAKKYLTGALEAGAHYQLGLGHGPVHHFFKEWG